MSPRDLKWRALQLRALDEANKGQFGIYTGTVFEMAEFLCEENRKAHALEAFMAGVYLSLNGPNNLPYPLDPQLIKELGVKRWELEFGEPITNHVHRIGDLAADLGMKPNEVRDLFLKVAEARKANMKTPLGVRKAWTMVSECLYEEE